MNELDKLIIRLAAQVVVLEQAYLAEVQTTETLRQMIAQLEQALADAKFMGEGHA